MIEAPAATRPREDLLAAYYQADVSGLGLIASAVAPEFGVTKRRGDYGVIPREAFGMRINTKRAPKSKTSESTWAPESDSFSLNEYAHKEFVDEVDRENYESWFEADEIATERVREVVDVDFEFDVAESYFSTTVFASSGVNTHAPSVKWDVAASCDPIGDIELAKERFLKRYRRLPTDWILPYRLHKALSLSTQVRATMTDQFGEVKPGMVPADKLAVIFGIQRIHVPFGTYNTAKQGQDANFDYIWNPDRSLLCCVESGRDLRRPQIGRRFTLARQMGVAIDSWIIPDPAGTYVRARAHQSIEMPSDPAGYLLTDLET